MSFMATVGSELEPTAVVEPREGAFDNPAVAAEPGVVLDLASCDHRLDAALPDQAAVLVVVVAAISDDAVGTFSAGRRVRGPVAPDQAARAVG